MPLAVATQPDTRPDPAGDDVWTHLVVDDSADLGAYCASTSLDGLVYYEGRACAWRAF